MAKGERIGGGYVDITADMTNFDNAMKALPKKAASQMDAAMKALRSRAAQNKLELKVAIKGGDAEAVKRLTAEQDRLKAKMEAVHGAATRQATAIQSSVRATMQAQAASRAHAEAQAQAAKAADQNAAKQFAQQKAQIAAAQAVARAQAQAAREAARAQAQAAREAARAQAQAQAQAARAARAATKAAGGQKAQDGGDSAMALMMLSQAFDDVQYGFRAIVNNIPMLGMMAGKMLGLSAEAAIKFGAIAGIAGVAINTIINHWDELFQRFGYGTETMKAVWESFVGEAKKLNDDAIDTIEARIKELEAKPLKLAVDTFELDEAKRKLEELKEARQAWEQMGKGSSPFERESGQKVAGLFRDMTREAVADLQNDLVNQRAEEMNRDSPAIKNQALKPAEEKAIREQARAAANLAAGGGGLYGEGFTSDTPQPQAEQEAVNKALAERQEAARQARQANAKKARDELAGFLAKAEQGDTGAQQKLAAALRQSGRAGLAAQVESLSPEAAADNANFEAGAADRQREQQKTRDLVAQGADIEFNTRQQMEAERDRESQRFAGILGPRLSKDILKPGGISDEDLANKVRDSLKSAGVDAKTIEGTFKQTARILRIGTNERLQDKMGAGGLSEAQAAQALMREDRERVQAARGQAPRVQSTEDYLRQFLVASGKPSDEIRNLTEAQLEEQKGMTKLLDDINKNIERQQQSRAAVFGSARR